MAYGLIVAGGAAVDSRFFALASFGPADPAMAKALEERGFVAPKIKKVKISGDQIRFEAIDEAFAAQPRARGVRGRKVATSDLDLERRPQTRLKLLSLR